MSQLAIDPEFLWMGETQREALSTLKCGIFENKAFLLITGDIGAGKTTLINNLVRNLGEEVIIARVPEPEIENFDFARFISHAIQNEEEFKSKSKFLIHFSKFLNDACADDKMVLLIINEGQQLKDLLQKILLSKSEKPEKKLSNIFPLRQNKQTQTQELDSCSSPQQRIASNHSIEPLNTHEKSGEVIRHRLRLAGAQYDIYSSGPILAVHAISDGGPRIICDHCRATGVGNEAAITAEIFEEEAPKANHGFHAVNTLFPGWAKGVSAGIFLALAFSAAFIYQTRSGMENSYEVGGIDTKAINGFPVPDATLPKSAKESSSDSHSNPKGQLLPEKSFSEDKQGLRAPNLTSAQARSQSQNRESSAVHIEPASPSSDASLAPAENPQDGPSSHTTWKESRNEMIFSRKEIIEGANSHATAESQQPGAIPDSGSVQTEQIRIHKVAVIEGQQDKEKTTQPTLSWDEKRKTRPQQRENDGSDVAATLDRVIETNLAVDTPATVSSGRDTSLATVEAMREMISRPSVSVAVGSDEQMEPRKAESKDILEAVSRIMADPGKSAGPSKAASTIGPNSNEVSEGNAQPTTGEIPVTRMDHANDQLQAENQQEKNEVLPPPESDKDAAEIIDYILRNRAK